MRRRPRANRRFREATRRLSPSNFTVSRVVWLSSCPHPNRRTRSIDALTFTIEIHSVSSGSRVERSTPESAQSFDHCVDAHRRVSQCFAWFGRRSIHTRFGLLVRSPRRCSPMNFTESRVVGGSIGPRPDRPARSLAAPTLTVDFHSVLSGLGVDPRTPESPRSFDRRAGARRCISECLEWFWCRAIRTRIAAFVRSQPRQSPLNFTVFAVAGCRSLHTGIDAFVRAPRATATRVDIASPNRLAILCARKVRANAASAGHGPTVWISALDIDSSRCGFQR